MASVYDSHEQGERVKSWLRENGGAILLGLVLAFGGLFGFKQWQLWQTSSAQQASAEYETMLEFLDAGQLDAAVSNFETLRDKYPDSAYVSLAALHMAKARIEASQPDLAVNLLQFVMTEGEPEPLRLIARERLARLQLDLGKPGEALRLIEEAGEVVGFGARFAELRGDIHRQEGDLEQAMAEYARALDLQETGIGYRPLLEIKLEALRSELDAETG